MLGLKMYRTPMIMSLSKIQKPRFIFARCYADGCKAAQKDSKACYYISKNAPPECGEGLVDKKDCPTQDPRLDWLFYRISDKANRQYQKTWTDCIEVPKPRRKCAPEKPKYEKRQLTKAAAEVQKLACPVKIPSKKEKEQVCPYQKAPGCAEGRKPPSCRILRGPADCQKFCCPYPSFSECRVMQTCTEPLRSRECYCNDPPSLCEIHKIQQQNERRGKF